MWDRSVRRLDLVALAITVPVAIYTLWIQSDPISDPGGEGIAMLGWSLAGSIWSLTLFSVVGTPAAKFLSLALLIGALLAIPYHVVAAFVVGPAAMSLVVLIGGIVFSGVLLDSRRRQLIWMAAPALVLLVLVACFLRWPLVARMTYAEPHLTAFAEKLRTGQGNVLPADFNQPMTVGSISVYEVYVQDGAIHLLTGFARFDGEAGLAYFPDEPPASLTGYEHVVGAWYRWPFGPTAPPRFD